jgi:hypothetical protein
MIKTLVPLTVVIRQLDLNTNGLTAMMNLNVQMTLVIVKLVVSIMKLSVTTTTYVLKILVIQRKKVDVFSLILVIDAMITTNVQLIPAILFVDVKTIISAVT